MERTANKRIMKIVTVGLMAALVYVGNYLSFPIPNGLLVTRIHLGNSMCLLAGLLFCGSTGGIASGIGAAMYDLFNPAYVLSAPYTFISKFAMGFAAGKLNRRNADGRIPLLTTVIAAVFGQLTYIVLYLVKSFFTVLILGGTVEAAWIAVGTNAVTSSVNAVLAVVISVPLYIALKAALSKTPVRALINEKTESKGHFNPVTVGLAVFAFISVTVYTLDLSVQTKLQKQEAEEKAALEERLEDYENRLDHLYEQLGIEPPITET
ncbi:MAG: ECF transporter S component [Bacteroides sp.]|nr:ECF transporter S component [Bacteroides sp.]